MTAWRPALAVAVGLSIVLAHEASALAGQVQHREPIVAAIQIRGNHTTPDAEVLRLAGVHVRDAATPALADAVKSRLDASGRFRSAAVRTRYASLTDLSAIVLVIIVEERVAVTIDEPSPGPLRRLGASSMWLPVLRYDDGYGFTYGARVSVLDVLGRGTRVSAPLTWGGERRAVIEIERTFSRGPLTRLVATGGVWRREHPVDDIGERHTEIALRAERAIVPSLRVGTTLGTGDVQFGDISERASSAGADVVVDTRIDPAFPRNAVHVSLAWDRLWFRHTRDTHRVRLDAEGYMGLFGQTVLALRARQIWTADPLPAFEQPLLGGAASLRGFRYGFRTGDQLTAFSAEVRTPISSPLHVGRAGWAVFIDRGATYAHGTHLSDAAFDTGIGAGFFAQLPMLTFRLDVARGLDHGTRAHVTIGATF